MPSEYRRALLELEAPAGGERTGLSRSASSAAGMRRWAKITGFLEIDRQDQTYAPAADPACAISASSSIPMEDRDLVRKQARPLHGLQHALLPAPAARSTTRSRLERSRLSGAIGTRRREVLHSTNNFPEFTGRICPAPCEETCTLNLEDAPGDHQDRSSRPSPTRPVPKAGSGLSRRRYETGRPSPSSARARPALPPPNSSARAGHPVHVYRALCQGRRPAALRHSRFQDGEADHRSAGRPRWRPKAWSSIFNVDIGVPGPSARCSIAFDAVLLARRRRAAARPSPCPASLSSAPTMPCRIWSAATGGLRRRRYLGG